MFNTIQRLYKNTHNKEIVINAVHKGWITQEDYTKIVGEDFPQQTM